MSGRRVRVRRKDRGHGAVRGPVVYGLHRKSHVVYQSSPWTEEFTILTNCAEINVTGPLRG
jgi:hypothetical protein